MKIIDLMYRTMYAELVQRSLDEEFEETYDPAGWFVAATVKDRKYWYYENPSQGVSRKSVGRFDDPEITKRVESFRMEKERFKGRRKLVSTLVREAGLTPPQRETGDVIQAMARAGLFRLRGVLVGTVAFQAYSAHLGVRLPSGAMQTGDADLAQFHSISAAVQDSIPPVLETLQAIDPTFRPIPHFGDNRSFSQFANESGYKVEFLTPNTGSDDHTDKPAPMPALGGAAAQPLRFLDFLIYQPVRSVMLHRAGIPILIPAPERYAVHKLIVASRRLGDDNGQAKRDKDTLQSRLLMQAMRLTKQHDDLATAFEEAWERGPSWREALQSGLHLMEDEYREEVEQILRDGADLAGIDLDFDEVFEGRASFRP